MGVASHADDCLQALQLNGSTRQQGTALWPDETALVVDEAHITHMLPGYLRLLLLLLLLLLLVRLLLQPG